MLNVVSGSGAQLFLCALWHQQVSCCCCNPILKHRQVSLPDLLHLTSCHKLCSQVYTAKSCQTTCSTCTEAAVMRNTSRTGVAYSVCAYSCMCLDTSWPIKNAALRATGALKITTANPPSCTCARQAGQLYGIQCLHCAC